MVGESGWPGMRACLRLRMADAGARRMRILRLEKHRCHPQRDKVITVSVKQRISACLLRLRMANAAGAGARWLILRLKQQSGQTEGTNISWSIKAGGGNHDACCGGG